MSEVYTSTQLVTTLTRPLSERTIRLSVGSNVTALATGGATYQQYSLVVSGVRCEGGKGCYIVDGHCGTQPVALFVRFACE